MHISGILLTKDGAERLPRTLNSVVSLVDEMHVFVDTSTTDDSRAVAEALGATVHDMPCPGGIIESVLPDMLSAVSSDWVLKIDDDETLGGNVRPRILHDVVRHFTRRNPNVTSIWFGRRWRVPPGNRYITTWPWSPDYQGRLYLRDVERMTFPAAPHEPLEQEGENALFKGLLIDHWDLVLNSRQKREAKVARYEKLRPEKPLSHFYLYEDYPVDTAPAQGVYSEM